MCVFRTVNVTEGLAYSVERCERCGGVGQPCCVGTLHRFVFFTVKIHTVRGARTDISAKTKTLANIQIHESDYATGVINIK